jgi:hypothetical protein
MAAFRKAPHGIAKGGALAAGRTRRGSARSSAAEACLAAHADDIGRRSSPDFDALIDVV